MSKYRQEFLNGHSYQYNWEEEPTCFNLIRVVRLLIEISTLVAGICILKMGYANLHLLLSGNKKEIAIQKIWNYWLKSILRTIEKYAHCLHGYLHFT